MDEISIDGITLDRLWLYSRHMASLTEEEVELPAYEGWPAGVHEMSEDETLAIRAAMAAKRPLLVVGESGIGKSQLARAAAVKLRRHFVSQILDGRTHVRDLCWRLETVRRTAEAQILGVEYARAQALGSSSADADTDASYMMRLAEQKFVVPGVLWWGFDWERAAEQKIECHGKQRESAPWVLATKGTVVLLDDIEKLESSQIGELLEIIFSGRFEAPGAGQPDVRASSSGPLVVLVANQERHPPTSLVRRCVMLTLRLPDKEKALKDFLMRRGRQHAHVWGVPALSDALLQEAVKLLIEDRKAASGGYKPGQSEFLDLLRATCFSADEDSERRRLLKRFRPFVLKKYSASGSAPRV